VVAACAAPFFMQLLRQLCLAIRFGKAANAGQVVVRFIFKMEKV